MLSLIKHLTIDFPSHFILSIIDVYRDTTSHDKLIFPSTITRVLRHFSIHFPIFDHFHVICAIDVASVKRSKMQFRSRRFSTTTPPIPSAPSTSFPFTSAGGMTLDAIIAQLQRMDAHLDTLSTELFQVNTRVSRIARWQARLSGFVESPSPLPTASETFKDDNNSDDDDDDEDGDASSSSINEMST